jgi:hypothetical protein
VDKDNLLKIGIQKRNKEIDLTWQEIADQYGGDIVNDGELLRSWIRNQMLKMERSKAKKPSASISKNDSPVDEQVYKDSIEIHKDGTQISSKLVAMSLENSKDAKFLLKAHGYDADAWELTGARSNMWNSYSKIDGIMELYSSKITVAPIKNVNNLEKLIQSFENVKPVHVIVDEYIPEEDFLLEIPLFDTHFGISDYEYYKPTQSEIFDKINYRKWKEILFIVGQDLFHNNDFRGATANGTPIEVVDMEKAWEDCCKFYEPLIVKALKNSDNVKVIYSKGNHDETISWAFVKYLKARFPQVECDSKFIERKIHTFGKVFIGITHGDKANNKDIANIFIKDFSLEWANSMVKEIHKGHFHVEDGKDIFGTMVRTLATRNKTDKWHEDKGFIGAHKRFMLFEYSETALKSIYYV